MMNYWLIKSEPSVWSWQQQIVAGKKGMYWNGVRNHLAKKYLQTMQRGDLAFFYHSNEERAIVGIVEVIKEAYPDPSDESGKFVMVDVRAQQAFAKPVSLAQIKQTAALENMALVKFMRLSVQPVTKFEWDFICNLGGV